jgi:hypothetical protein
MAQRCSKCNSTNTRKCSSCNGYGKKPTMFSSFRCQTCDGKGQVCAKCGSQIR